MSNILYLHGFASSPDSRKALWFRDRFKDAGIEFAVPDLECGDFRGLTVTRMVETVSAKAGAGKTTLMGSSLGGYVASVYAAMHSEDVDRLILMAPAFDFARRWLDELGATAASEWKRSGALRLMHYGRGVERVIGWTLIEDALRYPAEPQPPHPALVFHGSSDNVVPLDAAVRWCEGHSQRRLTVYEDGHDLGQSLAPMWDEMRSFLGI